MNETLDTHLQELRRGTVVLACLQLLRTPGYGYSLLDQLEKRGFATDAFGVSHRGKAHLPNYPCHRPIQHPK